MIAFLLLAQLQIAPPPAAASGASGAIDPAAATRAYIDLLPAADREKSNHYFEGGYWLDLVDFVWGAGVMLLLLYTGAAAADRRVLAAVPAGHDAAHVSPDGAPRLFPRASLRPVESHLPGLAGRAGQGPAGRAHLRRPRADR